MCNLICQASVTVCLFCLLPVHTARLRPSSLTLDDCIKIALENNPQIEIARQQYLANKGVLTQAKSFYWPHFSGGVDYGRQYIDTSNQSIDTRNQIDEDNVASGLLRRRS